MTCRSRPLSLFSLVFVAAAGCGDSSGVESDATTGTESSTSSSETETGEPEPEVPEPEPAVEWPSLACDPLVPEHCAYPYPNNVYSVDEASTETGRRLSFDPSMMPVGAGYEPTPDVWHASDGFSPASTMLTYLPGASITGLPTPLTIADSLAPDCPTVILDAETGERVPHWAELDMSHGDEARRTFMIRPARRLEADRRYIVAIRNVVDDAGAPLAPTPGFEALRDQLASDDLDAYAAETVELRRALYADIFARLGDAGIERGDLQLAWDFTTASDANITGRLVHMRDLGLDMLGAEPQFAITDIDANPEPGLAAIVRGELTVPLFLDDANPGGRMTLGPDGLPEALTTAEFPFMVLIPESAYAEPARLMQFGHGLFGGFTDVDDGLTRGLAIDYNIVVFATTWTGMSGQDLGHIISLLQSARVDEFDTVVDRLAQGVFNSLALMRTMKTNFADAPELLGPNMEPLLLDTDEAYFFGGSLGGIMGSVYMALTTDVERGALAVPGQPFSLLLNRSEAWAELATLSQIAYEDTLDLRFSLELMQQLWDRAEPSGFARHIELDPLPGTESHEVIVLDAIGDHLVTTLGAHIMAREIGIPQLSPTNRDLFGIDVVDQPYEGSVLIEYDFGLPPEPVTNVPMTEGSDPHGALANVPNAALTVEQFLRTGSAESFCDGVCDPS